MNSKYQKSSILGFISHFQREVVLFLKTRNGKVKGAESKPFELPSGWDFETMQSMITDQVQVSNFHQPTVLQEARANEGHSCRQRRFGYWIYVAGISWFPNNIHGS